MFSAANSAFGRIRKNTIRKSTICNKQADHIYSFFHNHQIWRIFSLFR